MTHIFSIVMEEYGLDTSCWDFDVDFIVREARRDFTKRQYMSESMGACEKCGKVRDRAQHHVKPLWVFAVEMLLDWKKTHSRKDFGLCDFVCASTFSCNDRANISILCRECHELEEKNAFRFHRDRFEKLGLFFDAKKIHRALRIERLNLSPATKVRREIGAIVY